MLDNNLLWIISNYVTHYDYFSKYANIYPKTLDIKHRHEIIVKNKDDIEISKTYTCDKLTWKINEEIQIHPNTYTKLIYLNCSYTEIKEIPLVIS